MPTYQYECNACEHTFEALQSMTEPKFVKCPECGKDTLSRLIGSGSGVVFKGSGFYETDYKKKSAPVTDKKPDATPPPCANSGSCPMKSSGGCPAG